ncbi:hypothetical protein GCM10025780_24130 [Frondihabitans cladoniiphilus]|uniref:Uncharacterized protein n=1 Tax=Frondihabitans cladoniiphilus TaxID=715785 RepID=A0ABP8W3N6_9MICO
MAPHFSCAHNATDDPRQERDGCRREEGIQKTTPASSRDRGPFSQGLGASATADAEEALKADEFGSN